MPLNRYLSIVPPLFLAVSVLAGPPMSAMASSHDAHAGHGQQQKMFLEKKMIDGFAVSFHVMPATGGMNHGGSHNLMIKVERDGAAVTGYKANSKVIHPDGREESRPLMAMGDWQMAGYDLQESGKSQLMVLFKTADGAKHFGGVFYPAP